MPPSVFAASIDTPLVASYSSIDRMSAEGCYHRTFEGHGVKLVKINIAAYILLAFAVILAGLFLYGRLSSRPPKEARLIQRFYAHRADYERIRNMLYEDTNVLRIDGNGVGTTSSPIPRDPQSVGFPVDRYYEYLRLLKQSGGMLASRNRGDHPDPGVLLWAWGFAGEIRHVGICWLDAAPTNQIATLDNYRGQSVYPNRVVVFRHVDTNWYLWTDL